METGYCPSCFQKLNEPGSKRLCPNCGFDLAANPQPQNALPWYTLLHGRYRVGRVLGQGGFGITYIGFDENLQRKVAIKEYYPKGAVVRDASQSYSLTWSASQDGREKESGCESFLREARKMARIDSIPGIVRIIDTFTENDTAYIIMDYLEGVTLRQYVRANGPMTFARCMELLHPLFGAIDELHAKGMIHRDISPDNIMIRDNGTVWLLDFGAAKDLAVGAGESSVVVARSGFSPSEQYSGKNIGPWTDVYALCATMYFCVSGRTLPDASDRVQDDSIPWEPARVPEDIRETIREGLSMRFSDRIQSVSELAKRLDGNAQPVPPVDGGRERRTGDETELVTDPGGDGGYSVSFDPFTEEAKKKKRKSLMIKISAAAAALLLTGGAVFAASRFWSNPVVEDPEESETAESTDAAEKESVEAGGENSEQEESDAPESSDAPTSLPDGSETPYQQPAGEPTKAPQGEDRVIDRSFTDSLGRKYTYTGEVSSGKPNGTGIGVYAGNGSDIDGTYTGAWKDGDRDGQGTITYVNGDKYEGEWKDGVRNGLGTYTYASGNKYVGAWKGGKRNGKGTMTYANGNKYVGQWEGGAINGQGTYTWADGRKYEGSFSDGKMHGTGTYTNADGDKYVGDWKDGKGSGTVTITYVSGHKYVGEWESGQRNGTGTMTYASGNKYEGQWKDGHMNGTGTYTYASGGVYTGDFKDDKQHGTGTRTYADGRKYVGEWKENKWNGQGVLYNADGSVSKSGVWENGELISGN